MFRRSVRIPDQLPLVVVERARLTILVLDHDSPNVSRVCVRKRIEDCRRSTDNSARSKRAGARKGRSPQADSARADDPRRPQRACQHGIDSNAKARQRERHDASSGSPRARSGRSGWPDRRSRLPGPGHCRHENGYRDRLTGTKDGAVERGEDFGEATHRRVPRCDDALAKRAGVVAVRRCRGPAPLARRSLQNPALR